MNTGVGCHFLLRVFLYFFALVTQEGFLIHPSADGHLEKETATHSSIHAWKIPWIEEPGGL